MVAVPPATPLTVPPPFTSAIAPSLEDQVIVRPDSAPPPASVTVAASCTVAPAATVASAGAMAMAATGISVTLMNAVSARLPAAAISRALPVSLPA